MKQEMDYSKYVDRYLDGVMSSEEEKWFTKELEGNQELTEELDFQSKLNRALDDKEALELEGQLDQIYDQTYKSKAGNALSRKKKTRMVSYGAAAAVILLVGVFALAKWFGPSGATDPELSSPSELYTAYYRPAKLNISYRAAGEVVDRELREAMNLYEQKQYTDAIILFERIITEDESRIGLNLYSGISHMELKEYKKAYTSFQKIIDSRSNAFIESAEWYLGLCYLKTNDVELAKDLFKKIASGISYYRDDAKNIIQLLE